MSFYSDISTMYTRNCPLRRIPSQTSCVLSTFGGLLRCFFLSFVFHSPHRYLFQRVWDTMMTLRILKMKSLSSMTWIPTRRYCQRAMVARIMMPPKGLAKEIQILLGARQMKRRPLSSCEARQRDNSRTEVDGRIISLLKANYRHSFDSSKTTPVRWQSQNPARNYAKIGEFLPSAPRIKVSAGGVSRIRCSSNSTLARHVSFASVHSIRPSLAP